MIHKKGFTLIELIVVIAVMAILSAVAVPRIFSILERSRISADKASLKTLNTVTSVYRITNESDDPFEDRDNTSEVLMGYLVDSEYIPRAVTPQKTDAEFIWDFDTEVWLYSIYLMSGNPLSKYIFSQMSISDFVFNAWGGGDRNTWSVNEEGIYVTGENNNHQMFFGNARSEYTLTTKFKLDDNPGNHGGLGIFFETVIDSSNENRDTGYILQFDRGWSEIVLRKRVEGSESNSDDMLLARIGDRSSSTIKNSSIPWRENSEWWESEKEISITVKESGNPGEKLITVTLDGENILSDFVIESDVQPGNNHTGFRAWNNQPAVIYEMEID